MSMSGPKVEKGLASHYVHVIVLSIECSFYLSTIVIICIQTQEADRLHLLAPSAIWQESQFKQVYLQFLSQNYLTGITDFIKTFVHTN